MASRSVPLTLCMARYADRSNLFEVTDFNFSDSATKVEAEVSLINLKLEFNLGRYSTSNTFRHLYLCRSGGGVECGYLYAPYP